MKSQVNFDSLGGGGEVEVTVTPNAQLGSSNLEGGYAIVVKGSTTLGSSGLNASVPIMTVSPAPSTAQSNIGTYTRYDGANTRILSIDTSGNIYADSNISSGGIVWNVLATYSL